MPGRRRARALGAVMALAALTVSGAPDAWAQTRIQRICAGGAASSTDLLITRAILGADNLSYGGLTTLWLGGVHDDAPVSAMVAYEVIGYRGAIGRPSQLVVLSQDPAAARAVSVVVTLNGARFQTHWRAGARKGGSAEVPGALKALREAQAEGADIGIALLDKDGSIVAEGHIQLPRRAIVEKAQAKAFADAASQTVAMDRKVCTMIAGDVSLKSVADKMNSMDAGAQVQAGVMTQGRP